MSSEELNQKSHKWEKKILVAKGKHRPILTKRNNWGKDGFRNHRYNDFLSLRDQPPGFIDISQPTTQPNKSFLSYSLNKDDSFTPLIDRISCSNLSYEQFVQCYEIPEIPVIISDIPQEAEWKALDNWNFKSLKAYKKREFKCGEDDDGYRVRIKLKYFLKYLKHNTDDSPLYIFDSHFDDDPVSKTLMNDFSPPVYFPDDLFSLVGEKRRPPYRWILIGPERSGTCVHIDPLGTSAWNTVVKGSKKWVVFPPDTPKNVAKALDVIKKGEDDEAINYFVDFIPRLKQQGHKMYEFIQLPGDTVFIPGGWWHAVINLEDTIAITQNFCSRNNLIKVWRKTRTGRRKMAIKWRSLLAESHPSLVKAIDRINEIDGFDSEEFASKNQEEKRHKKSRKHSSNSKEIKLKKVKVE